MTPRSLRVHLAPQQLASVMVQGQRLVEGSAQQIAVVNPNGHWQASVDALRALLLQPAFAETRPALEISLSSRWSQMVLAPWSDVLLSEPGAGRFLQSQLTALYGDHARGWSVVSDDAPYGQARAVCGVDSTLLQALRDTAAECGLRCRIVEPLLATAIRSVASTRPAALAVIEAGRITMAALNGGRIAAIQTQPASNAWRMELPQAWQRWTLRAPELAEIAQVAVVDLGISHAPANGSGLQLVPETLPARFRMEDSPFGAALKPVPLAQSQPSPQEAA